MRVRFLGSHDEKNWIRATSGEQAMRGWKYIMVQYSYDGGVTWQ